MLHTLRRAATAILIVPLLLIGAPAALAEGSSGSTRLSSTTEEEFAPVVAQAPILDIAKQTIVLPDVEGLRYETPDGTILNPGLQSKTWWLQVAAYPLPGYSLVGTFSWTVSVTSPAADPTWPVVVIEAPTADVDSRTVTIPDAGAVQYAEGSGDRLSPGTHRVPDDQRVMSVWTQTPGSVQLGIVNWAARFTPMRGYAAVPPEIDYQRFTVGIPDDPRVTYTLNRHEVSPGTYFVGGRITIGLKVIDRDAAYDPPRKSWKIDYPDIWPVTDISRGMQHYEDMRWMLDSGISSGWLMPGNTREYRPLNPVNRDAMASFMFKLAAPHGYLPPSRSPFSDVSTSDQHYTAIAWAYQEGITTGWVGKGGKREFRPTTPINRDAMAAFLYRFAGEPSPSTSSGRCFTDVTSGQQFAAEMCWMKAEGISTGWPDGTYRPLQPVKRDAMAAFLHRYSLNS